MSHELTGHAVIEHRKRTGTQRLCHEEILIKTYILRCPVTPVITEAETFLGLSGMGDLIVTCTSLHSRNHNAGYLIGKGYTMQEAMDEVKQVVEGVYSAKAAMQLARKYEVELPIIEQVNEILFNDKPAAEAVRDLMIRDKKIEIGDGFEQ